MTAPRLTGAERLAATFGGDPAHPFLHEASGPVPDARPVHGQTPDVWTVGRLLAYAGDVARAVPREAGPLVAVRSHGAAFVVASLLGLWKSGRAPLLIDPAQALEPAGLRADGVRMAVLAPRHASDPWCDVAVTESAGSPIAACFPASQDAEVAFFTSGSTGEPKIVRKMAFQFGEQHAVEATWLGVDGPVSVLCLVPAFHILGYIYGFSTPAAGRGTTRFVRGGSPQAWVDQVHASNPDLVVGVPSHYRLMAQILTARLPKATYLCSGGPLGPAVAEEFRRRAGHDVVQVYGSTETGGIATRRGVGPWQPFPGLGWQARPRDGRLLIRSTWQELPGEWYETDDVVAAEERTFHLLGRSDSVVKIGGRRFSTGEVVRAALASPSVEQAHAVVYARFGEPAVALFVVPPAGTSLASPDVRAFLAARLASFKVPRTIGVLAELPTRGIGKVDDDALRALATRS
jgi:acyl-coenzyme A synthetase/AMP-(fatty) acid ligase